jgi:CDP-glycerol glycerophosphotransferase
MPEWIDPKPEQVFVQCWHGTPLKCLGFDVKVDSTAALNTVNELSGRFYIDAKKWNYLLSPSTYTSERLLSAFGASELPNIHVLEKGYPRNDSIINTLSSHDSESKIFHIKQSLCVDSNKKVLLYAPTWRASQYKSGQGYVGQNYLDFELIAKTLSKEWIVLLRTHYYITNSSELGSDDSFLIDVSQHNDVNDLYIIADVLLTDYSSVLFDYANTERPTIYHWPDFEEYRDQLNGFYFDPLLLPGPKCTSTLEVIREIQNISTWKERVGDDDAAFRQDFCYLDDGNASNRVIKEIVDVGGAAK